MFLLDLSNEVLLDILSLVEPVDLVNVKSVCKRLRGLAERIINNAVLKLNLTGIDCFPDLNLQPFNSLDRIRVNKNWLDGKFSKKEFFTNHMYIRSGIVLDKQFYVAEKGAIRKYDRLWNGKYLNSQFKMIGNVKDHVISKFAKKDNVIFAGCYSGTCMIFQDEKPAMKRVKVFESHILDLDLFPKNDIYVTATYYSVQVWNKRANNKILLPVDKISKGSRCLKIGPSGEKLIIGFVEMVTLYDFNTMTKEDLVGLDGVSDLLWKDNQSFLSGYGDGSLRLFDLRTRSVCQKMDVLRNDNNISLQFDGQNAVLCGFECSKTVSYCDLRMNKVLKNFQIWNEQNFHTNLIQIAADPKHLFVVNNLGLQICDFSV